MKTEVVRGGREFPIWEQRVRLFAIARPIVKDFFLSKSRFHTEAAQSALENGFALTARMEMSVHETCSGTDTRSGVGNVRHELYIAVQGQDGFWYTWQIWR